MSTQQISYSPPYIFRNGHVATILSNRLRRVGPVAYNRSVLETLDGDFLDLDISRAGGKDAVVILHGLEGSSLSGFVRSMAKLVNDLGMDAVAMNQRSCSGRPNRLFSSYHSGKTDDLRFVLDKLKESYRNLHLIGFSLGGNIALKLAGEGLETVSTVTAVSVPCDLSAASAKLEQPQNFIYKQLFLKSLMIKVRRKIENFPEHKCLLKDLARVRTIRDFDDTYTAPFHGFASAGEYYSKSSSLSYIPLINTPTLIINALNDPFLGATCHPTKEAGANPAVKFLNPHFGGHIGFLTDLGLRKTFWHEEKISGFIASFLPDK